MGIGPRELLRRRGSPYEALGSATNWTDRELIAVMVSGPRHRASFRVGSSEQTSEVIMLRWFHRLMPKEERFFELFRTERAMKTRCDGSPLWRIH